MVSVHSNVHRSPSPRETPARTAAPRLQATRREGRAQLRICPGTGHGTSAPRTPRTERDPLGKGGEQRRAGQRGAWQWRGRSQPREPPGRCPAAAAAHPVPSHTAAAPARGGVACARPGSPRATASALPLLLGATALLPPAAAPRRLGAEGMLGGRVPLRAVEPEPSLLWGMCELPNRSAGFLNVRERYRCSKKEVVSICKLQPDLPNDVSLVLARKVTLSPHSSVSATFRSRNLHILR